MDLPNTPDRGINMNRNQQDAVLRPDGKNYLLVIGINNYQFISPLNNAQPDAAAFRDVLLQRYQFEVDQQFELFDDAATAANIYERLTWLARNVQPNDNLVLYFSGHGLYNQDWSTGFWIPVEGREMDWSSFIPFDLLSRQIEAIPSFHTLIIADACYAGSLFTYRDVRSEAFERLYQIPSRYLITSGRNEVVPDGPAGQHSPFAGQLLWLLRNNVESYLNCSQLADDLIKGVAVGRNPTPRAEALQMQGHRGGQYIFRLKGVAPPAEDSTPVRTTLPNLHSPQLDRAKDQPPPRQTEIPVAPIENPATFPSVRAVQKALLTHLRADDLDNTLGLFNQVLDFDAMLSNSIILLQARLADNNRQTRDGTASTEHLQVERNRIRHALISYIQELEVSDLDPEVLSD